MRPLPGTTLAFELPARLEATAPPEARGLERDEVRMLVAERGTGTLRHRSVRDLPGVLAPGDLVVVNTSATLPAALPAQRADGTPVRLHLSTPVPGAPGDSLWVAELRGPGGDSRVRDGREGETIELPAGGRAVLAAPYISGSRLWVVRLALPQPLHRYLEWQGAPIRYRHVTELFPLADYQTIFAAEPGSAEMPSAGRPFTPELVTALAGRGIGVAPVLLHTGVSSLERGEAPYPERYRVPEATARRIAQTRSGGGRVIAVGTTVVRALETVAGEDGAVRAGEGWTRLVITPARGVRAVDGMLTGWHEPEASHLLMLEAIGGRELVERSYEAALEGGYLWHEFGDSHLLLP